MPSPKKAPAKSAPKPDKGKDLRRAYEHRGRVEVLRPSLGKNTADVDTLIKLAEKELAGSNSKDAADLLRAAEHLTFGYLSPANADEHVDPELAARIEEEFDHKSEKAEDHWEKSKKLSGIYDNALSGARQAFENRAYRRAMELVRAAEAIAHVHLHDSEKS